MYAISLPTPHQLTIQLPKSSEFEEYKISKKKGAQSEVNRSSKCYWNWVRIRFSDLLEQNF